MIVSNVSPYAHIIIISKNALYFWKCLPEKKSLH